MFTVQYLNSLQPRTKPYRVYEKAARPGFGVQVAPKGTKTFFYGYKINGKQRFMKLGIVGKVTLKAAGEEWLRWHNVRQTGSDPQIVRDNSIREQEQAHQEAEKERQLLERQGTFEQLLEAYVSSLRADGKRSADNIEGVFRANAYKFLARSAKAKDVTAEDIDATLYPIEQRGAHVMVNRMRSYLSAAFTHGIKSDKKRSRSSDQVLFGIEHNPVRDVLKSDVKEKPGDRNLSEDEIKRLWYGLETTRMSLKTISALKLLLVTGQRPEEVLRLNVHDFDKSTGLWELSKTKADRAHVIPLPDMAAAIIDVLEPDNNGYCFASKTDEGGNTILISSETLAQACSRFCKTNGFDKFTPRDLRRTWKTLTGKAGISKFDRDRYQNHALNDVSSQHYDRYDYLAEKRTVAAVWNDYLAVVLNPADNNQKVVPIKKTG